MTLDNIGILIIHVLPLLFLIASLFWQLIIDKEHFEDTLVVSGMVFTFLTIASSSLILELNPSQLILSFGIYVIFIVTSFLAYIFEREYIARFSVIFLFVICAIFYYLVLDKLKLISI